MNIVKLVVKETALIPYRVLQGLQAAMDEIVDPKRGGGKGDKKAGRENS